MLRCWVSKQPVARLDIAEIAGVRRQQSRERDSVGAGTPQPVAWLASSAVMRAGVPLAVGPFQISSW